MTPKSTFDISARSSLGNAESGPFRIAPRGTQIGLFTGTGQPERPFLRYKDVLTTRINVKGVLDVDVVKGCFYGMRAYPGTGCYGACYAAKMARRGRIDFARPTVRTAKTEKQRREIEKAVSAAPQGFFRIGVMGDPCHAWEETTRTVEWLSAFARGVVITKHWKVATDEQLGRLAAVGAVLNTSVSALDAPSQLKHRTNEISRYKKMGGTSVARVVSCNFARTHAMGARLGQIQDSLFELRPAIDNPLRVTFGHPLAIGGIINVVRVQDMVARQWVSIQNPASYIGFCDKCPDVCGIAASG